MLGLFFFSTKKNPPSTTRAFRYHRDSCFHRKPRSWWGGKQTSQPAAASVLAYCQLQHCRKDCQCMVLEAAFSIRRLWNGINCHSSKPARNWQLRFLNQNKLQPALSKVTDDKTSSNNSSKITTCVVQRQTMVSYCAYFPSNPFFSLVS